MLQSIAIKRLFDQFDYQIDFKPEGVTILTGPNGYGKTTILNIIYSIITKNIAYLIDLPFVSISLNFDENKIYFNKEKTTNEFFTINGTQKKIDYKFLQNSFKENIPIESDQRYWFSRVSKNAITNDLKVTNNYLKKILSQLSEEYPEVLEKKIQYNLPERIKAYLIKEQRLLKTKTSLKKKYLYADDVDKHNTQYQSTIVENAKLLSQLLTNKLKKSDDIARENDSSYVNRLLKGETSIEKKEFDERYGKINKTKKALNIFGLATIEDEEPTSFKNSDAKALSLFLDDTEKKLFVFKDLLKKLELFVAILNKRDFTNKKIKIAPEFGYKLIDNENKEINLDSLSSGEQHELILIYELIFNATENSIVLIDEPEISLHVVWQKEFIKDLTEIIKLNRLTVIVATHSPQIINGNWDLTIDLFEQNNKNINK